MTEHHTLWSDEIKAKYSENIDSINVQKIVRNEVEQKFSRVLSGVGVYKMDTESLKVFKTFTG